ncbi:MAG: DUF362 domain-containing protein [Promethearchaeota archaeon]|nr:MAG: DUF362 domain-containing protein [Candidatus Lokiarchaeota archaeon]
MMAESNMEDTEIVISKGNSPSECYLSGIEKLGGMRKFITEGDQVFIKCNLTLPSGIPSITNLDTLNAIIQSCITSGAKRICVGSFPSFKTSIKAISDSIGLEDFFEVIGAELIFLDNSDYYHVKNISTQKLKNIKKSEFSTKEINNNNYLIPEIILNSDKLISVNQVVVEPIFDYRLSLNNSFSIVSNKDQEDIIKNSNSETLEKSKELLASRMLDLFAIKKPDLIVNDLFYILERAGPMIFRDSNLRKTNLMVIGNDAIAVDLISQKIMDSESSENILLLKAKQRNLGISDQSKIKIIGESIDEVKIKIERGISKLEDLKIYNISIKSGNVKLTDFNRAYQFLNFIDLYLMKDLKYLSMLSFLVGEDPPEPEFLDNIIIFGDDAIKSTKNRNFGVNKKSTKKAKSHGDINILRLPGNPPNIHDSLELLIKYFSKHKLPVLNLLLSTNYSLLNSKITKQLDSWEAL